MDDIRRNRLSWKVVGVCIFVLAGTAGYLQAQTPQESGGMVGQADATTSAAHLTGYHRIRVVDMETSRGVPCIRLKTADSRLFYTDSAGMVAFGEPDLLGKTVYVAVEGFGYKFATPNAFGQLGRALKMDPGSSSTLLVKRINIAERLYRITGSGIYRDSMLLGDTVSPTQDETTTPVTGMDSVQTAIYRNRMYWFWGDTSMSNNPLGNFKTTGATSDLPGQGLNPENSFLLNFFRKGPLVKPMFSDKHMPIWIGGLRVIRDPDGQEMLLTNYSKVNNKMQTLESGLAVFRHEDPEFEIVAVYPRDSIVLPNGHVFEHEENGTKYFYFANPWPFVRTPATIDAATDLTALEAFTCVKEGRRFSGKRSDLDRDRDGRLRWGWKRNTSAIDSEALGMMLKKRLISKEEAPWQLRDTNTTAIIQPHTGSVYYNDYRRKWISVRTESLGLGSPLGEIWYFEADTPLGPWAYGQKIVSHRMGEESIDELTWGKRQAETYSFYNPLHHPEFDSEGGRIIYFEGTYTATFAGPYVIPTPGYDYNQIMYKLDLASPLLRLPVAIYRVGESHPVYRTSAEIPAHADDVSLAFFAPERQRPGTVPIFEIPDETSKRPRLTPGSSADGGTTSSRIAFYAVDSLTTDVGPTLPLYEYHHPERGYLYTTRTSGGKRGYKRNPKPVCRVWPAPVTFDPVGMSRREKSDR